MVWAGWISLSGCLTRFIYLNLAAAQGQPYAGVALHQGSSVLEWLCAGWLCAGVALRWGGFALGWLCAGLAMRWGGYALGWLYTAAQGRPYARVALHQGSSVLEWLCAGWLCAGVAMRWGGFATRWLCDGVAMR